MGNSCNLNKTQTCHRTELVTGSPVKYPRLKNKTHAKNSEILCMGCDTAYLLISGDYCDIVTIYALANKVHRNVRFCSFCQGKFRRGEKLLNTKTRVPLYTIVYILDNRSRLRIYSPASRLKIT